MRYNDRHIQDDDETQQTEFSLHSRSNENLFTTDHYTCVTSSFAKSEESIVNPVFTSPQLSLGSNVMNNFMLLFTEIKKPYYLTNIYEHYDGSLSYLTVDKTNDTSKDLYGVPFVKGARHLVSANTVSYNSLQGEISSCVAAMEFQGSQWTMTGPGMTAAEAEELFAQKVAELESMIPIWNQESRDNPNDWIAGETDFDNVRERYLDKGFALYEFEKQNNGFEFFHDLAIVQGLSTVNADVYYEFDAMSKVIDPLVYGVVDLLGVIPGVDFLADGAGVLYATARGDAESVFVYSAAFALPFVGAGVIHTGQKFFRYYGKQSSSNVLELTVKQWDEAHDGWVKLSNDIPYEDVNKTTIKNELEAEIPKLTDEAEEILEKVVVLKKGAAQALKDALEIKFAGKTNVLIWIDEVEGNITILNKLDELPSSTSVINALETDISVLKTHFNTKPDLIDSWKVAESAGIDQVIRSNSDFLNMLDKYPVSTAKKTILNNATNSEWQQILSGKLVDVPDPHPNTSTMLREKFGPNTQTSKKFDTDPSGKEFDAITDQYLIEHKELSSTNPMSSAKRTQMRYHIKACGIIGKDNYLILEGIQNDDWINKAIQYANEFGVNTKIELNGILIHNITF